MRAIRLLIGGLVFADIVTATFFLHPSAERSSRTAGPFPSASGLITDELSERDGVADVPGSRDRETIAYFAAVAAFSINAATSRGCKRKMAWGPGSSMVWD
jgi:hypothetical protein